MPIDRYANQDALDHISEIERRLALLRRYLTSLREEPEIDFEHGTAPALGEAAELGTPESAGPFFEGWLNSRDIAIKQLRGQMDLDSTMDRFAFTLGSKFDTLRPFYEAVKKRVGGAHSRPLSVQKMTARERADVTGFGNELLRHAFLKQFRYEKSKALVFFEPQEDGRVTNFFTGNWLERYVVLQVKEYLATRLSKGQTVEVLVNPQVTLPDGRDFELDVLIAAQSGRGPIVMWFECKTGSDHTEYIARYKVAAESMEMSREQCALVLLKPLSAEEKLSNAAIAGMAILNLSDLPGFLERAVGAASRSPGIASY